VADTSITPAPVAVPEADLDDLRDRLRRTRWPEAETVDDWSQGVPLAYVRELCAHWADAYDWRATEARLNSLGPVRTTIDGLGIHALHVPSPVPGALPLVVTHGWPGSVVEFLDVVGPLTDPAAHGGDPADAFHLVVPSLPGYGFSDRPAGTGWGVEHVADAWVTLMARLGYERFGAQGGDWGAAVTTALGERHADRLVGIHLNMPVAGPAPNPWPEGSAEAADAAAEEQVAVAEMGEHRRWGTGYSRQQSTRPQTLGYGLVDSPAGQCAWIVEKFWAWTDCDGHPENALTRDQMLDDVMLYWLPATAASSARLYWESFRGGSLGEVTVPTGCSIFPCEITHLPRHWVAARYTDLRHWHRLDRGGHFAAFEQPDLFVDEVRTLFRLVR
jgi:pimeloyl-ACP methyl ester carboxylesterase